jgi:hypothetical protein
MRKLFAHFLRKSFCAPPNSTLHRNYFRGRYAPPTGASRVRVVMRAAHADARARSPHTNKSAEKKRFRKRRRDDRANSSTRSTGNRTVDPPAPPVPVASGLENILPKVLTVEKTVFRFRAADMTCRRE